MLRSTLAMFALYTLSACSSPPADESRTVANDGRMAIRQSGEHCRLNLDGDATPDTIEITNVKGKRAVLVKLTKFPEQHIEELSTLQHVECVTNQEPGVPVRGTDEDEKAISVAIMNDYLRVEKQESSAKLVYFDNRSKSYRALYQAD